MVAYNYPILESLVKDEFQTYEENDKTFMNLTLEVRAIRKKMTCLPTTKESDAEPELVFLRDISNYMQTTNFKKNEIAFFRNEKLQKLYFEDLFAGTCLDFLKTRIYTNKNLIVVTDEMMSNLVTYCSSRLHLGIQSIYSLLNVICDKSMEFYKNNGRESNLNVWAFGVQGETDFENKKFVDSLKKGDNIDALRTSGMKHNWSRAVFECKESSHTKLKFFGESSSSYSVSPYSEIRPFRSKSLDFEWREDLKENDLVDYYFFKSGWVLGRVVAVIISENYEGEKTKQVEIKKELSVTENPVQGAGNATGYNAGYFNTSLYEENTGTCKVSIHCPALAKPNTFSKRSSSQIDDSQDLSLIKSDNAHKVAILRPNLNNASASIYFVRYINLFAETGGFKFIEDTIFNLQNQNPEMYSESVFLLKNFTENLFRPYILKNGETFLSSFSKFQTEFIEKDIRSYSQHYLGNFIDAVSVLSLRVYHFNEANNLILELVIRIGIICLKSEILEKQFFGAKLILNFESQLKEKGNKRFQDGLVSELLTDNLLEKILKGHPSLIAKSSGIIKTLFIGDSLKEEHIGIFWNQVIKADAESRLALVNLIKELTTEMNKDHIRMFSIKITEHTGELTAEVLELIGLFRRISASRFEDKEITNLVTEILWKNLQSEREIKKEVGKEIVKMFVRYVKNDQLEDYIPKIVENIVQNHNKSRNLKLLVSFLKDAGIPVYSITQFFRKTPIFDILVSNLCDRLRQLEIKNLKPAVMPSLTNIQLPNAKMLESTQNASISEIQSEISKIFKFLRLVLFSRFSTTEEEFFKFEHFEMIYNELYRNSIYEKNSKDWLIEYLKQKLDEGFKENCKRFFIEKLPDIAAEEKECFLVLFIVIFRHVNISEGKLSEKFVSFEAAFSDTKKAHRINYICEESIDTFFGIHELLDLFLTTNNKKLYKQLAKILISFYLCPEFSENENQTLYGQQKAALSKLAIDLFKKANVVDAQKAALLLMEIIRKDENKRENFAISFAQLRESEQVFFNVEKDLKYMKDKFKVKMSENFTLQTLKFAIADQYKVPVSLVSLSKSEGKKISDFDNFQTLENMGICTNDLILYRETNLPETVEIDMLNEAKTDFSDHLKLLWKEVFDDYSNNGLMTTDDFARFTTKVTGGTYCYPNEDRVLSIFREYGVNEHQNLNFYGFLAFFRMCATSGFEKRRIVKENIACLGYSKNFKLKRGGIEGLANSEQNNYRTELTNDISFMDHLFESVKSSVALSEQRGSAKNDESICFVLRLFDILPISKFEIEKLLNDPIEFLSETSNIFIWNYKITLIHSLIFRQDFIEATSRLSIHFFYSEFVEKICDSQFFDTVFSFLESSKIQNQFSQYSGLFCMTIVFIEKVLRSIMEIRNPELLETFTSSIVMNFKNKNNENKKNENAKAVLDNLNKVNETEKPLENFKKALIEKNKVEELFESFKFSEVNTLILDFLNRNNQIKSRTVKAGRMIMKTSINALAISVFLTKKHFLEVIDSELLKLTMFEGLTHEDLVFQVYFKNIYEFITSEFTDVRTKITLLKILISKINSKKGEEISSLVDIACNILTEIGTMKTNNSEVADFIHKEFNFTNLFLEFLEQFLNHKSKETVFDHSEDPQLISLLAFLEKILIADEVVLDHIDQKAKLNLAHHLFAECLFKVENKQVQFQGLKCHSKKSRALAFGLLIQILKNNIRLNIHFMVREASPLIGCIPNLVSSASLNNDGKRIPNGFLGIRNPGCICYMIATLQQFYCIPAFRYGILMADDKISANMIELKGEKFDDNYFHQFQKMIASLDLSERKFVNPLEFCQSYKDYSNQPVNLAIQQDADEFLKIFLDKIERKLKGSPFTGAINSVCLGKVCNSITCKGCGHVKTNSENFYNLSLEVKNMKNISESLEKLIEPETISDYTCDSCKIKCDISKQALLEYLPNVLFLSLKKMYFDLELLANVKIHAKYEFPMNINFKKYMYVQKHKQTENNDSGQPTQPANSDEDFDYKLRGVVIHKGNAAYGHYTSLIRAGQNDPARKGEEQEKWLEFDDSRVTQFDMKKFEEECFGSQEENEIITMLANETDSSKSAYLLVYEKVKKTEFVFEFNEETITEKDFVIGNLIDKNAFSFSDNKLKTGFYNLAQYIPEVYNKIICQDNQHLILEQNLLSKTFTKSMAEIFGNVSLEITKNVSTPEGINSLSEKKAYAETVLRNLPLFLSKIYCVSSENEKIYDIVLSIERALDFFSVYSLVKPDQKIMIDKKICSFYNDQIFKQLPTIINAITNSTESHVHMGLSEYLVRTTNVIVRHFGMTTFEKSDDEDDSEFEKAKKLVNQLLYQIGLILSQNDGSSTSIRKNNKLFMIAFRLSNENPSILQFFTSRNLMPILVELYNKFDHLKMNLGEKSLCWVLKLILHMYSFKMTYININPAFKTFIDSFKKIDLLVKMSKEDYGFENYETLKQATYVFAFNDKYTSETLIYSILRTLSCMIGDDFGGSLEALKALVLINDEFQDYRIQLILGTPRLNEFLSTQVQNEKRYLYGLAKDPSIKKPVMSFYSFFGFEKGILEMIISGRDYYENQTIQFIQFLVEMMLSNDKVFNFVLNVGPCNYISATFFDWFYCYCNHHSKKEFNEYNSYKLDILMKRIKEVYIKLDTLKFKIEQRFQFKNDEKTSKKVFLTGENPYQNYYNYYSFDKNENVSEVIWSPKPNYIIGKTLGYEILKKIIIEKDHRRRIKAKFTLIKVAMIKSEADGLSNNVFPDSMVLSDLTINTFGHSENVLSEFFTSRKRTNSEEIVEMADILDDNENPPSSSGIIGNESKSKKVAKFELPNESNFLNSKYILRMSISNTMNTGYFLKFLVTGSNGSNFKNSEIVVSVVGVRHDYLIHTICLEDPTQTFEGLNVRIGYKSSEQANMRYFSKEPFTLIDECFEFKSK